MSAQLYRIYNRPQAAVSYSSILQHFFNTATCITWLFLFAQSFKYIFLTTLILGPKLLEAWAQIQEFFQ